MKYSIIVDSCCDATDEMKNEMNIVTVPLTMKLGEKEFTDDENLDLENFMSEMKACTEKVGSAAPTPYLYKQAMEEKENSFVVTLSSKLSGSYSSAVMGKSLAEEKAGVETHVFDSKSASAGEVLVALKIKEFISEKMSKENIIQTTNKFIDNMKTYFVLENYDNLLKNGRLNKITGILANLLNIKLVMGSDGHGNIKLFSKPRGTNQMLERLMSLIKESGKKAEEEKLVISHCNNPSLAKQLSDAIKERFNFKEIFIVPTKGLSSLYADNKGVIMAF